MLWQTGHPFLYQGAAAPGALVFSESVSAGILFHLKNPRSISQMAWKHLFISNLSYGINKIKHWFIVPLTAVDLSFTFVSGHNGLRWMGGDFVHPSFCELIHPFWPSQHLHLGNLSGCLSGWTSFIKWINLNQIELRSTILFILFITKSQSQLTPPRRLLLLLSFLPVAQPKTTQQHSCKPPEWGIRGEL